MKRLLGVLLSLGIVMVFSASAFAVSADFLGQAYYRGWYIDNPNYVDKSNGKDAVSSAFVDQRIRLYTNFKIVDGLQLSARMDWLEDKWGAAPPRQPDCCWRI